MPDLALIERKLIGWHNCFPSTILSLATRGVSKLVGEGREKVTCFDHGLFVTAVWCKEKWEREKILVKSSRPLNNSQLMSHVRLSIDSHTLLKSRYNSCTYIPFSVRALVYQIFSISIFSLSSPPALSLSLPLSPFGSSFNHLAIIIVILSRSLVHLFNRSALLGDWIVCWNLVRIPLLVLRHWLWK